MGLAYTPKWILDPGLAVPALEETRKAGFGLVIGFVRHMHLKVSSEAVRDAVAQTAAHCHKLGMKFALDMDWAHWAGEYVERNPDMAMWTVLRGYGVCIDGQFEVNIRYPGVPLEEVAEISAAYGIKPSGNAVLLSKADYECRCDSCNSAYPIPSFDDDRAYSYYRPGDGAHYTLRLSGTVDRKFTRIVFYVAFMNYQYPDVTHPTYLQAQSELLGMYSDVPLDGVGWDESGKGGNTRSYKAGKEFFNFFRDRHGYELRNRLMAMDDGVSPEALKTRLDYYDTLNEINFRAQAAFNKQAMKLFGKDIFRGMHHTFAGLATDIRCGCSDYFRLGKNLSHSFTDTGWDQGPFSETTYNYALAEGMRKELGMPGSYCNDWSRSPRVKWYEYFARLKMLYRIDWFAIFIGLWCERHSLFPDDRYWKNVAAAAQTLNRLNEFLSDKYETISETAVWFGWESVGALPASLNWHIRLFQTFHYNFSQVALESGKFFDYVSNAALIAAKVRKGRLNINDRSYKRLVIPYGCVLNSSIWNIVKECAKNEISVVFTGPPPCWITESDENVTKEFCELIGVKSFTFDEYNAYFLSKKPKPSSEEWEPEKVDFAFPLIPGDSTEAIRDKEGNVVSVTNPAIGFTYLSGVDPRDLLASHLGNAFDDGLGLAHRGQSHIRLLRHTSENEHVLILASKMDSVLDDLIKLGDISAQISGGCWAILKIKDGKVIDTLLDEGTKVK